MPHTIISAGTVIDASTVVSAGTVIPPPPATGIPPFGPSDGPNILILSYGQSLSLGTNGNPALTTVAEFDSLDASSMLPLVEATVETHVSASTNSIRAADGGVPGNGRVYLAATRGVSGAAYAALAPGTTPYNNLLALVAANQNAAALIFIHGEADSSSDCGGAGCALFYRNNLATLRASFETDARAITSQLRNTVMFITQMSSFTQPGLTTSEIPIEQLAASVENELIQLVAPLYHLGIGTNTIYSGDGVHLGNNGANGGQGYRLMGDYIGRAMLETFINARPWEPLRPTLAFAAGTQIFVEFSIPSGRMGTGDGSGPLVLDTTAVREAFGSGGSTTYGFKLKDPNQNPRVITGVSVAGDLVVIDCDGLIQPGSELEYAMEGLSGAFGGNGFATGAAGSPRGNLRDTDTSTGHQSGERMVNWCTHFRQFVDGGTTGNPPVAVVIEDKTWDLAYGTENLTTPAQAWADLAGTYSLPYVTGTYALGGATGANAGALDIGASRVNNALINTNGVWRSSGTTLFDSAANDDILVRYVGEIMRPGASQYILWYGAVDANNAWRIEMQASGNLVVVFNNSGQNLTTSFVGALPASSTYGLIDVHIRKRPGLEITIAVNGSFHSASSANDGGANTGLDMSVFGAFNNSGPLARNSTALCFAGGHKTAWWSRDVHTADANAITT